MEQAMSNRDSHQADYPVVETIVNSIADWVSRYRHSIGGKSGLGRCNPEEVMAVANDLGVSPGDLQSLGRKGPESIPLLRNMLAALKIDPQALIDKDPLVMRDLQRLCTNCHDQKRCRQELEKGTAADHFHEFCPNAFTLDALFEQNRQAAKN
jgi:hypothetical protein